MGYYTYQPEMTIEEVAARWVQGDKAYDCEGRLPRDSYCVFLPWQLLWPYREDDRPLGAELLEDVRARGWQEAGILHFGRNGGVKLGEGNHRLQVARALDTSMPVRFSFYEEVDTPTDASRWRRAHPTPRPPVLTVEELLHPERAARERRERRERETSQDVDDILDILLGVKGLGVVPDWDYADDSKLALLLVYNRPSRGVASRALHRARLFDRAVYRSIADLVHDGVPRREATPRYEVVVTPAEAARLDEALAVEMRGEPWGLELYVESM